MGYIAHDAIMVTASDHVEMPDVDAFRRSLPEEWRPLVVGPVKSVTNSYLHFVFLPDGSKEGWDTSDQGDAYRQQFADLFSFGYEGGLVLIRVRGRLVAVRRREDPLRRRRL